MDIEPFMQVKNCIPKATSKRSCSFVLYGSRSHTVINKRDRIVYIFGEIKSISDYHLVYTIMIQIQKKYKWMEIPTKSIHVLASGKRISIKYILSSYRFQQPSMECTYELISNFKEAFRQKTNIHFYYESLIFDDGKCYEHLQQCFAYDIFTDMESNFIRQELT